MLNRSIAPAFSGSFSFELPKPEIIRLNDSLELVFLRGLQQDVFKLEFVFKAGKWWESKKGLSHFTSILLDKGTQSKSSKTIAAVLDYYGSQIEISPSYDFTSVSLFGLKKHFNSVFPLLTELLTDSIFPEEELALQKEIFIQNLKINNEKNSYVASKLLRKNIFGSQHPYGNSIEEPDVTTISSKDLAGYFNEHFAPHEIYLMGNFSEPEIQSILKSIDFASQSSTKISFTVSSGQLTERVNKTESVQSSIRLGKRVINRNHPDYFALLLLNHILGGYFGSRLMKNIREEKGLTYGIYSSINPFKNDCLFSIGADVGKDKTDLALSEIKLELQKLKQQHIAIEELDTAKNHLMGSLQLEIASPFAALDKIKNLRLNHLSSDYYQKLFDSIRSATPTTLQSIANNYLLTDNLFEISVG